MGGAGLLCLWDEQSRDVCQTLYLAWFGFWKTQIYLPRDLLFLDLLKDKQIHKAQRQHKVVCVIKVCLLDVIIFMEPDFFFFCLLSSNIKHLQR